MNSSPETNRHTRTLLYIPIIHTHADMGAMGDEIRRTVLRTSGARGWQRKVEAVSEGWDRIDRAIARLPRPLAKVRLYQDGLPVCGREKEIVEELAQKGSRNHRLLVQMMSAGATLMGTESVPLLQEEYERTQEFLAVRGGRGGHRPREETPRPPAVLLRSRDEFIADRINHTLQDGETGILFLGMLHSLTGLLDPGIRVVYPVDRPATE
jgi:hypothetical protein